MASPKHLADLAIGEAARQTDAGFAARQCLELATVSAMLRQIAVDREFDWPAGQRQSLDGRDQHMHALMRGNLADIDEPQGAISGCCRGCAQSRGVETIAQYMQAFGWHIGPKASGQKV